MNKKKYGLSKDEIIRKFSNFNIETRSLYVGDDYQYSIFTANVGARVWIPKSETNGNRKHEDFEKIKKFSKKVLKIMPKIKMKGKVMPRLL